MRALVVYASEFGSTRAIADRIGEEVEGNGIEATVVAADAEAGPTVLPGAIRTGGDHPGRAGQRHRPASG